MATPRIIAGTAKGIRLKSVPGKSTRPITDRVKEALFNILGVDIVDSEFFDLFGGTGSVGLEALSRGAKSARFLELNQRAFGVLKSNIKLTKLEKNAEVLNQDAFKVLARIPDKKFDYIFIAPPQYKGLWLKALEILDKNPDWLVDDGWIIVQIDPVEMHEIEMKNFVEVERRKYGSTILLVYEREFEE